MYWIKGEFKIINDNSIEIENNKIGYLVYLKKYNENNKIFIYEYFNNDQKYLLGFEEYEKLKLFEEIITYKGIGIKTAYKFINAFCYKELRKNILINNKKLFSEKSRIKEKTIENIINTLKKNNNEINEVYEVLIKLNYDFDDIDNFIKNFDKKLTNQELINLYIKKRASKDTL